MPRVRTINQAVNEIKKEDPMTAITYYYIRALVAEGKISCIRAGNKVMIDIDELISFLTNQLSAKKKSQAETA